MSEQLTKVSQSITLIRGLLYLQLAILSEHVCRSIGQSFNFIGQANVSDILKQNEYLGRVRNYFQSVDLQPELETFPKMGSIASKLFCFEFRSWAEWKISLAKGGKKKEKKNFNPFSGLTDTQRGTNIVCVPFFFKSPKEIYGKK